MTLCECVDGEAWLVSGACDPEIKPRRIMAEKGRCFGISYNTAQVFAPKV